MNCSAKAIRGTCPLLNDFDKLYARVKAENFEGLEAIKKEIIASALIPVLFPKGFPERETLLRML